MGKEVDTMIGIIAAMEEEMSILKENLSCLEPEQIQGIYFYEGKINERNVVLCTSGVGKVNAAMAASLLLDHFECDFIINTGIAGGITGVEPEDIIIAKALSYFDVDATPFQYAYGQVPGLPKVYSPSLDYILRVKQILKQLGLAYKEAIVYSGDSFVVSLEQVSKVDTTTPCVAEMEGAAIAQVCTRAGANFIVLRYVSDVVGKPDQISDYSSFESQMARRSSKICLEILKKME